MGLLLLYIMPTKSFRFSFQEQSCAAGAATWVALSENSPAPLFPFINP